MVNLLTVIFTAVCCSSEKLMKMAATVPREDLLCLGTCFGKITHGKKFRLHITALDFLAPYAKVSVLFHPPGGIMIGCSLRGFV